MLLFLLACGQVMYIKVTSQTFREASQDLFLVRCRVALDALGHIFVLGVVTGGAIDLAMLAGGLLPDSVDLFVAGTAGHCRRILGIGYRQRIMNRMTLCACGNFLTLMVRLVTGEAGRDETV